MQHDRPDLSRRTRPSELQEILDGPCARDDLRVYLRDLAWLNRTLLGYRPVLDWLDDFVPLMMAAPRAVPIRILDVGCGQGDTLRRVERWARGKGIGVELMGVDINADAIAIAKESSGDRSRIRWEASDVFAVDERMDLVMSSLFTHHLEDDELVRFIAWMEQHAALGWCINDLSRHPTPYRLFRWFSRLAGLHPHVQHDGAVSIARAFIAQDWQRYCAAAGLSPNDIEIRGFAPGRLRVTRRKQP